MMILLVWQVRMVLWRFRPPEYLMLNDSIGLTDAIFVEILSSSIADTQ
jgi:hypothetical protein